MTAVMEGVRILEVAEHTFVPAASALLADWGAEVIKVEHVERGDAMRGLLKSSGLSFMQPNVHVLLEHSNRGKQSIGLDLATPHGLDVLYKLAATCDVFLTNKMPSVRTKLKIDVDDLRAHNPDIIYVRGTGQGERGPDADKGSYDSLAYWNRSGIALGPKAPDAPHAPTPPPAFGDSIGAMTIAGGIMGALFHRERTGEATTVDVSLLATGMWSMGAGLALSLQLGIPWGGPAGGTGAPGNPLMGNFEMKDGRQISLCCLQPPRYWAEACELIGRPELATDERFTSVEGMAALGRGHGGPEGGLRRADVGGVAAAARGVLRPVDLRAEHARGGRGSAGRRERYVSTLQTAEGEAFQLPPRRCSTAACRPSRGGRPSSTSTATPSSRPRPRLGHDHRPQAARGRGLRRAKPTDRSNERGAGMDLKGKKAMVVGGASGMARAAAEKLVERGASVAILDRPQSAGAEVAESLGGTFHPCDVTDDDGTEAAIDAAVEALDGSLHVSVNTAGGGGARRTLSKDGPHPLQEFRGTVELNLISSFNVARLAAAHMARNEPEDEERGVIISTASIAAFEGQIGQVAYTAAKAGIAGMMLTMARDLGSLGIRALAIAPSLFATGITQGIPDEFADGPDQGRRLPQADGPPRGVRQARGRHRREPDAERLVHPARRRPALRAEVARLRASSPCSRCDSTCAPRPSARRRGSCTRRRWTWRRGRRPAAGSWPSCASTTRWRTATCRRRWSSPRPWPPAPRRCRS